MNEYICPKCGGHSPISESGEHKCRWCTNEATRIKRNDLLDKPISADNMLYDKECSASIKENYITNNLNE